MIVISTTENLVSYLKSQYDMSNVLAKKFFAIMETLASKSKSTRQAFDETRLMVEKFLSSIEDKSMKAKKYATVYGYSNIDDLIYTLQLFLDISEEDELFIENEYINETDVDKKVWSLSDYSLYVDSLTDATRITLFKDDTKIGSLTTEGSYTNKYGKWLKVSLADIIKSYRGLGLGKQLYTTLLKYCSDEYKGIASHLKARYNETQIPKIYQSLGGYIEKDFAFIPKTIQEQLNLKKIMLDVITETCSSEYTLSKIYEVEDKFYWKKYQDVPSYLLDKIGMKLYNEVYAIVEKKNNDIWTTTSLHPISDDSEWKLFNNKALSDIKDCIMSNVFKPEYKSFKTFLHEVNYGSMEKDVRISDVTETLKQDMINNLKQKKLHGEIHINVANKSKNPQIQSHNIDWEFKVSKNVDEYDICSGANLNSDQYGNVLTLFVYYDSTFSRDYFFKELTNFIKSTKSNEFIRHEVKHFLDTVVDKKFINDRYYSLQHDDITDSDRTKYISQHSEIESFLVSVLSDLEHIKQEHPEYTFEQATHESITYNGFMKHILPSKRNKYRTKIVHFWFSKYGKHII